MQQFFLVLFTLSAICTTSQVVFPGKLIWVPLLGDPSDERIAAIGGNASPGERRMIPVILESEEVKSIGTENPSRENEEEEEKEETRAREKEDESTQNTLRRLLKLGNKTEGPKDGAAAEAAAKAAVKATIAASAAAKAAAVAEKAAKAAAVAATTAAGANAAVKVEREQISLINDKEAEEVSAAEGCRCWWPRRRREGGGRQRN